MQWNDNGNWATVINEFEVQYAPSLRVLQLCFERTVQPMSHALIVANPVGDLPLAHTEAQILVRILPHCQILEGSQGTLGGICRNSHGCGIVHLATHGTYDALSASRSGLLLASEPETRSVPQNTGLPDSGEKEPVDKAPDYGQLVTIHQIFDEAKVPPGALVVLSACDSGTPLADTRGERFISLAAGFLAAGASGVICSQWPVSDLTSVLFMALFYSKFRSLDSVSAVAGTARTLRSLTAEGTCRLWNSYFSDALDCGRMDVAKLGNALGLHLEPGSNPFDSPYFWGSFNVWGRACPAISRG
jgi:CHAT domain-containing protein